MAGVRAEGGNRAVIDNGAGKRPAAVLKRLFVKASVRLGLAVIVPAPTMTWPPPPPLIWPAQVGLLPPVRSKVAPEATVKMPLESVPPLDSVSVPVSTRIRAADNCFKNQSQCRNRHFLRFSKAIPDSRTKKFAAGVLEYLNCH